MPREISNTKFTCTASSVFKNKLCSGDKNQCSCESAFSMANDCWVTKGTGIGEWIEILFNDDVVISKIVYTPGSHGLEGEYNQNFKDVSFSFSDGTHVNATLDDVWQDMHFNLDPIKLSSSIKITANTVYKHPKVCQVGVCSDRNDHYGIDELRIYGFVKEGKRK